MLSYMGLTLPDFGVGGKRLYKNQSVGKRRGIFCDAQKNAGGWCRRQYVWEGGF